jgi:UDP-N-acetylmuramoylalanine--D-glutamate ligase
MGFKMKIAIAGYGTEGKSNYQYFKDRGEVTIADEREEIADLPTGAKTILGKDAFSRLQGFDMVVRSPSINPKKIRTNGKIWSATNEFFARCETPIIGVTGSKGKGTTSSLIHSILQAGGLNALLVGNIGMPALDILDEANEADAIVYELSSFQLWDAEKSPQIAVVLGIERDHLDVHADMDEYVNAKANIRRHQDIYDYCYYHPTNAYSEQIAQSASEWTSLENETERKMRQENAYRYASKESVFVKDGFFVDNMGRTMASVSALKLPGAHNIENACAAIAAAQHFTLDRSAFERGLTAFTGLDHRLKLVGEVDDVKFYDDSIATTPGSAIAALRAFAQPKVIILGGSDKGADYDELIQVCRETDARVVAIGQTGEDIARLCREQGVSVHELGAVSMDEVVEEALVCAQSGAVVILSPASASFDMFSSYSDRGDQFIAAVKRREEQR